MADTVNKTVFRFWTGWNAEKLEPWLEQMAVKGWLLQSTGGLMLRFHFRKGEPTRMRYALDYQEKDTPEYRQLLCDAGWRLLGTSSGWFLWGQSYENERPQIYPDLDGLIQRNQRAMNTLTACFAAQLPLGVVVMTSFPDRGPLANVLLALWAILFGMQAGIVIAMGRSITRLKKRKDGF